MDCYAAGSIIYRNFNTHKGDGTPITLAGSPAASVYKDDGTTEDDSGITLTVDFDAKTGLHNVKIDTSADGTFYATGHDFSVVLTAGTVDSISVVGYEVFRFRLGEIPADAVKISGDDVAANNLEAACDGGTYNVGGGAVVAASVTTKTGYELAADQAVNAAKIGGTTQTGRDLGASVLISPGTGVGQLDVTSGVVKANLVQIIGTILTETAGQIAAGFKKFFDVAVPVLTTASVNQSADNNTKITTIEGAVSTVNGKVDDILADTGELQTDLVNGGRVDLLIDGIKAKTDLIPASPAAVGSKMDIVDAPSSAGKTALANAAADQVWDEVASGHVASGSAGALLGLVHSILGGKQQIIGNQLVCYAADNATEVARFNLFDAAGDPTMVAVYLRTRA